MLRFGATDDTDPENHILFLVMDEAAIERMRRAPIIFMMKEILPSFPKCEVRMLYAEDLDKVMKEVLKLKPKHVHDMRKARKQ